MDDKIYSISELNQIVRGLLESRLPDIWISGEISNLARPTSGHWYFTLKDDAAQIRCAFFKNRNMRIRFQPDDGQQVLARGKVSLYAPRGDYQFIVEEMQPAGEGVLQQAFEALKKKLEAEGLFSEAHKKPLPEFPQQLGIITSPTGAAIRDVLTVLKRRFPMLPVLIYPVPVQGEGAAEKIAAAIRQACSEKKCDVLLLTRGGGSLEDLWSFNEEIVARAVYDCKVPIVCGVGHEVDFSIADFVADLRAPTPSAAAELISPDGTELYNRFEQYRQYFTELQLRRIHDRQQQVDWLEKRLTQQHPERILQQRVQRVRELKQRLMLAGKNMLLKKQSALETRISRLQQQSPDKKLLALRARFHLLGERMQNAMRKQLELRQNKLGNAARALHLVSPLATLERGYAIVTHQGKVVQDAGVLDPGDTVKTKLAKGSFSSEVKSVSSE